MRIIAFISLLLCSFSVIAQNNNKKEVYIRIDEYYTSIDTSDINIDSLLIDRYSYLHENMIYRIKFFDKKGSCFILKMNTNMDSIITGTYYGIDSLIKSSVIQTSPKTGQFISHTVFYYKPVKDGVWYYYTQNGKDIRMEIYNKGKLVKTKRFSVRK